MCGLFNRAFLFGLKKTPKSDEADVYSPLTNSVSSSTSPQADTNLAVFVGQHQ